MQISWIFRLLEKMHVDNNWDTPVGETFGEIADWLESKGF